MDFTEANKLSVKPSDLEAVQKLLVMHLCGENFCKKLNEQEEFLLGKILVQSEEIGLGAAQFNELLLLLEQPMISAGFFEFFFGKGAVKFDGVKNGIVKFRGFAMLIFGNYRYAYKTLHEMDISQIREKCLPYSRETKSIIEVHKSRPNKILEIEGISREQTWFLGYISKGKFDKESKFIKEIMSNKLERPDTLSKLDIGLLGNIYSKLGKEIKSVEGTGSKNTDVYLTWDSLDVYVATSMRHKWEYEETFDFISDVFSSKRIDGLKLRHFDPTQSQCENRIDKGLVEGLMLKRAICTIYMAQETDTMGKDSELAATLAQGKPVIAYVPKIEIRKFRKKIEAFPLEYFSKRLFLLNAEGILEDTDCMAQLRGKKIDYLKIIDNFLVAYRDYRDEQFFSLWTDKEKEFKNSLNYFSSICEIISICEYHYFEKRARTLRERHPLSIQVYLETGVANGVLVVRDSKECSNLLFNLITNSLEFLIGEDTEGSGATVLKEKISKSPFRVVTKNTKLTNSFWVNYFSD